MVIFGKSIGEVAELLLESKFCVVFTGAGVSAESGIPTFRGKNGLWSKYNPEEVASIEGFMRDPSKFWNLAKELIVKVKSKPNPAHYSIARLEDMGIVKAVITQNIDRLHQKAGSKNVIELHGSLEKVRCIRCGKEYKWEEIEEKLEHEMPPKCECGSIHLKPNIVFFNEPLDRDVLRKAFSLAERSDLFIVVGSSLVVYPAALIPLTAKDGGAKLVLINKDPTEMDYCFDIKIYGKAGEILPEILRAVEIRKNRFS